MAEELWYRDGLRFACTQCGNCCTGPEGYVWVNEAEVRQIAEYIGKSVGEMRIEHTKLVGRRTSLKEFPGGDCTFFDGQARKCTIYPVRPRQCRTWPFWNSNLETPEDWAEIQQTCPGAGKGQLYTLQHIQQQAAIINI